MDEKKIQLTIDRHVVEVNPDMTLLEAAKTVGIEIPTLCHMDLKGTCVQNKPASCRLCVVEVEGRRNLAPACATKVMPGMVVHTNSGRVIRARKTVAELILSDHPNDCLTCPKCSDCELQRLVMRFNIREMPFNGGEQSVRKNELTLAIKRNMDKCRAWVCWVPCAVASTPPSRRRSTRCSPTPTAPTADSAWPSARWAHSPSVTTPTS